ncbi:hypothetical protein OIU79_000708 [Salix purpurea]|uniref:Uncharacterized protein n=1 Tax=Salix purpurea TaxID=77065 RepID=A0A9Q0V1Z7_SALPP|nr:hypothetical protein OIU79_000708 [Salix purpurea]
MPLLNPSSKMFQPFSATIPLRLVYQVPNKLKFEKFKQDMEMEFQSLMVSKRRKLPHTAFALHFLCFLESLIPCTSLELLKLCMTKNLCISSIA